VPPLVSALPCLLLLLLLLLLVVPVELLHLLTSGIEQLHTGS
jgi:hypothetical protein